jgi:serine/threonine protein kinase
LAARNVLIAEDWRVRVADFGLARVDEKDQGVVTESGDSSIKAPECLEDSVFTLKSDVFAFGVFMWYLAQRQQPW